MYDVILSNKFKKDLKTITKRGYDLNKLFDIVDKLSNNEILNTANRDHSLEGDYSGFRECHIESDWLLIYKIENDAVILFLSRTGTHSDLF